MLDLRPVGFIIGLLVVALGAAMLLPASVDLLLGDGNGPAILQAAMLTMFTGGAVALACANAPTKQLGIRQAFVLTAAIWFALPAFGSLPLILGEPDLTFTDAMFEAVSGITTTGSTVIVGLDHLPAGTNLWRGMLNWLGGLGIAFIAMIFLPVMRVGGMQFFRTEGFDTLGKVLPRATDIARALLGVYTGLTALCIATYLLIGMEPLDAVVNGVATIATGGFSPSDASFGKYPGAGEYAGTVFMILGAMPYIRFVQLVSGAPQAFFGDSQIRAMLRWMVYGVGIVTLWRVLTSDQGLEPAFREASFNLVSVFTGTGFFSGSFANWGGFGMVVAFCVGMIGGCSSSSSGALSVFRVQVVLTAIRVQIERIGMPDRMASVRYEGRRVEDDVMNALILYVTGYILAIGTLSVALTLTGVDPTSALFGVWTSIGNIGYGYGPLVARTGTFIDFPELAKWVLILAMLMGRLALLALVVLVLPRFWRQ
ncbi:potassium transporter TrkH [Rhodobacter sphaeroides]|jgi:trk system potassium uptake protein TrkH|uniref:Trk system potassium uptake protein n=1 Tax=Cereibacter sphaeroides (strain ATCC 17023 / DSM 158 / JCM 6121 / CCUG 31486 / LMG 2827 / NBRC 12203 / NCIMB 8253 / ATH 2.4.1.) TaxID=272943 RepID=Q3J5D2_CERS4|nr:TrkH family potassium uptake protein [Cereibacter sphaeroides]ABN75618.1 cation transporter [Cereibacter sphaeroides ATCC 17029]ABA78002.1 potassium uptake transporter, transmembrane component, TrkH [Cereibacter sphaeroides 2.4.1]AMJ46382.1 potassium transporter TrkH [Cereibacter sphaeroides]ANS33093.1 potassium transporter TrkH [Cereibacter sphaeroides]ATN62145.1 potassium transporter TrkH [Cereibacter sphaeroides]